MLGSLTQLDQVRGRGKSRMIRANTTSTNYNAGTVNLKGSPNRSYLLIQADATVNALTIQINGGTGTIKLKSEGYYEPWLAPTGTLTIVSDGPFVIVSDSQNQA